MINRNKVAGMGETILVSGATGTVGSEVVKQLSSIQKLILKRRAVTSKD
jgi:FlaA1/EpsC-like NDP-sugar epimerase